MGCGDWKKKVMILSKTNHSQQYDDYQKGRGVGEVEEGKKGDKW